MDASVQTSVQVAAPFGERWMRTDATPEPASEAVAVSETVPRSVPAGTVAETAGATQSAAAANEAPGFVVAAL